MRPLRRTVLPSALPAPVVATNQFPTYVTADAAFDYWYVYETVAQGPGIAAIPLNTHGHEEAPRDPDGTSRCWAGLRMHHTYQFQHTNGFRAQRFRCPLLFSERLEKRVRMNNLPRAVSKTLIGRKAG